MRKSIKYLLCGGPLMLAMAFSAHSAGVSQQQFDTWVAARCGTGEPVYWYARGDARAYPGGEVLFRVDFVEENRLVLDPENPKARVCLGRKMSIKLDKDTGAVLREFRGQSVAAASIYPYQMIAMSLHGDRVAAVATQGSGKFLRTHSLDDVISVIDFGGRTYFDAAAIFSSHRKEGDLNTFEYLTYVMPVDSGKQKNPNPGLSMMAGSERPVWAGGDGKTNYLVEHVVGGRVSTYEELPAHVRQFIKTDAPIFRAPPANVAEIKRLQQ